MFSPIEEVLEELRRGRMVVLTDDEERENEGDLVLPAQFATPESVAFMLREAAGYLCLSLTEADCDRLDLGPQAPVNTSVRGTAFTISIDGHPRHGFTTGVSARERADAIRLAIEPSSGPDDFVRPGHINPLRARDGGVLVRAGQTEGSVDLCKLAGLAPAAVIIEIMREDGEMARVPDLVPFCEKHGLKMCSVAQIVRHRLDGESLVRRIEPATGTKIRTRHGDFDLIAFDSMVDPQPYLALTVGGVGMPGTDNSKPTIVRMHRRSLLGDVFGDLDATTDPDSSSRDVLDAAMRAVQAEGRGAIVYLRPEDVGSALDRRLLRIRRPDFQSGADALDFTRPEAHGIGAGGNAANDAMLRTYGIGCQILRDLGLRELRLLTNSQTTLPGLDAFGLSIVDRVPLDVSAG
ncbi:MAG: 3,4-dihydroxy-2-butanone-4-phosphate synthase [Planctomycetota bacterium]